MNKAVGDDDENFGYFQQFQKCFNGVEKGQWLDELGVELMLRLARIMAEEEVEAKWAEVDAIVVETGKDVEGVDTMESGQDGSCSLTVELNAYITKLFKLLTTKEIDEDKMEWRVNEWQKANNYLEVQEKLEAQVDDKVVTPQWSMRNKTLGGDDLTRENGGEDDKKDVEMMQVMLMTETAETKRLKRGRPSKVTKTSVMMMTLGECKDCKEDKKLMPVTGKVSLFLLGVE